MIEAEYARRHPTLRKAALDIENHLKDCLLGLDHIDRVGARAKSVDRFVKKASSLKDGLPKYSDPLSQIQDQIGARIITFYLSDVENISRHIESYYRPVESKNLIPELESEFGYVGKHYILLTPTDIEGYDDSGGFIPDFFELQIKTLFQHAWSEAEHDLGYKPGAEPLTTDQKRQLERNPSDLNHEGFPDAGWM